MSFLVAAFLLGLCVSITINACGGDKEQGAVPGGGSNNSGGGSNNSGTAGPANMWDYGSGKITKIYEYDESGNESLATEHLYDSQKREIGYKTYYSSSTVALRGKVMIEYKNYVYSGNTCTYEMVYYTHDYKTGELISTKVIKRKTEYLE